MEKTVFVMENGKIGEDKKEKEITCSSGEICKRNIGIDAWDGETKRGKRSAGEKTEILKV